MVEVAMIYGGDIVTFSDSVPPDAIRGKLLGGRLTMYPAMRSDVCGKTSVVVSVRNGDMLDVRGSVFTFPFYMVRYVNGMPFKHYWENYVANSICMDMGADATHVSDMPDLAALLGGDFDA